MAHTYEFYRDQADAAKQRADDATLDNVKQREMRAHKSWLGLADQARRVALGRAEAEAKRAAERATA